MMLWRALQQLLGAVIGRIPAFYRALPGQSGWSWGGLAPRTPKPKAP